MVAFFGALLGLLGLGAIFRATVRPKNSARPPSAQGAAPPGFIRVCGIVPGPDSCWFEPYQAPSAAELERRRQESPAVGPAAPGVVKLNQAPSQFWYNRGFNGEPVGFAPAATDIYYALGEKEKAAGHDRRDLAKAPPTEADWRAVGLVSPAASQEAYGSGYRDGELLRQGKELPVEGPRAPGYPMADYEAGKADALAGKADRRLGKETFFDRVGNNTIPIYPNQAIDPGIGVGR